MSLRICFYVLTFLPIVTLALGLVLGGLWPLLSLFVMLGLTLISHPFFEVLESNRQDRILAALPILAGFCHFILYFMGIAVLTASISFIPPLAPLEKLLLFLSLAQYFALISNGVGHELIHRASRFERALGTLIFASHLFGHHASSHMLVHHIHVGTKYDPNSARLNESFYRFWLRAFLGSFKKGLLAENKRRAHLAPSLWNIHPYSRYLLETLVILGICAAIGGFFGVLFAVGFAFYAHSGLLLTDYVQHYGLRREMLPSGKLEPLDATHSWNAKHWFLGKLTFHALSHSEHHTHPSRAFFELHAAIDDKLPILPYAPTYMSLIALFPQKWKRVMNPLVEEIALRKHEGRAQRTGFTMTG